MEWSSAAPDQFAYFGLQCACKAPLETVNVCNSIC